MTTTDDVKRAVNKINLLRCADYNYLLKQIALTKEELLHPHAAPAQIELTGQIGYYSLRTILSSNLNLRKAFSDYSSDHFEASKPVSNTLFFFVIALGSAKVSTKIVEKFSSHSFTQQDKALLLSWIAICSFGYSYFLKNQEKRAEVRLREEISEFLVADLKIAQHSHYLTKGRSR